MTEYYQKPKRYIYILFQNHIHKVKVYPNTDNFTQALLVMLVTNIMSDKNMIKYGRDMIQ